ncbi:hypothetical protein BDL97_12G071100 [Sphagnum fallax]|jgi:hypothetical protein|nr:hypothetical protein BDL97_12G071100 [Sphagnum fallax]
MSTTGDHQRIPKSPHQPAGWTVSGLVVVVMCVFVGVYGLVGLLQDVVFQCPRSSVRVFGPTSGGFAGNMTGQQLMPKETITTSQEDTREISCAGKYVYLYDLPPAFNQKFVDDCRVDPPWVHICGALTNNGLGEPLVIDLVSTNDSSSFSNILLPRDAWYKTHQFTLDLYYHQRLKEYPCLTHDPDKAVLSYIPFYSALDLTLKLYNKSSLEKDRASQRLIGWLQSSRHWLRTGGHNHVLLFGRIIWDYTKGEFAADGWGNSLSKLTELQNVTKISIERAYYSQDQRAVPYPTSFHPYSDDQIVAWQRAVLSTRRDVLVVFAGAPRSKAPDMVLVSSLRRQLMTQCSNSPRYCSLLSCNVVDCERSPHLLTQAFLKSVFCLQPRGDSATRKGVFDCLIAGSIPVFFSKYTAYRQYMWHLPHNGSSYSVFLDAKAVSNGTVNVIRELKRIPLSTIASMQQTINGFLPNILYSKPGSNLKTRDAFNITLQNLLDTFRQRQVDQQTRG